jgi:hypothetical protein
MNENCACTKEVFQEIALQLRELNASVKAIEAHLAVFGYRGFRVTDLKSTAASTEGYRTAVARLRTLIEGLGSIQ